MVVESLLHPTVCYCYKHSQDFKIHLQEDPVDDYGLVDIAEGLVEQCKVCLENTHNWEGERSTCGKGNSFVTTVYIFKEAK